MHQEETNQRFRIIMATLFIIFGTLLFFSSYKSTEIMNKVALGFMSYFFLTLFLFSVFYKKNVYLDKIFRMLTFPIYLAYRIIFYMAPIMTVIIFFSFYIVPTSLIFEFVNTFPYFLKFQDSLFYLVNVLALLTFAYFGNKIMIIIIESFGTELLLSTLHKYTSSAYTRTYSYFLMISIYITYNFISFADKDFLNSLPVGILAFTSVIKEVFVTFVAIDTLIQILDTQKMRHSREDRT